MTRCHRAFSSERKRTSRNRRATRCRARRTQRGECVRHLGRTFHDDVVKIVVQQRFDLVEVRALQRRQQRDRDASCAAVRPAAFVEFGVRVRGRNATGGLTTSACHAAARRWASRARRCLPPARPCRQEERHVGAERACETQPIERRTRAERAVHGRAQHRGRVARAASQAGLHRNALAQRHAIAGGSPRARSGRTTRLSSPPSSARSHANSKRSLGFDRQFVGQIERYHDAANAVVAVVAPREDLERQVDLRRSPEYEHARSIGEGRGGAFAADAAKGTSY